MLNREDLIKKVKTYNRFFNPETLSKAYNFALNAHKNQKRDSGDPYVSHPVAVANILKLLEVKYKVLHCNYVLCSLQFFFVWQSLVKFLYIKAIKAI